MLEPILAALPDEQRRLWPALADGPDSFVLYGGTALALRLGHRSSVDFDFFSSSPLDHDAVFAIPFVAGAEVLQREPTALTLSVMMNGTPVSRLNRSPARLYPRIPSRADAMLWAT